MSSADKSEEPLNSLKSHTKAVGICEVALEAEEGCPAQCEGSRGYLPMCGAEQDGWKQLPSTWPPPALLMTSALASGTNIP